MIKGFGGASIWSQDLNNLLPFYRDTLGLKPTIESERFVPLWVSSRPSSPSGSSFSAIQMRPVWGWDRTARSRARTTTRHATWSAL